MRAPLPVDDVLPELTAALASGRNVVVVAPPGAGKTTRVPQAIIDSGVLGRDKTVTILEPRRLAARLAARRIASERGAKIGGEVGYQVRFDDRTSAATRIAFLTEGILTRRLQSDPTLDGIGCVVLDEIHERSVHADLALAFLREIRETIRPDLPIIAMSATLDAEPLAKFLGDAAIVRSEGRLFPVELSFLEEVDDRPLWERAASGVKRVLRTGGPDDRGDILVFLPGAPEIRRTQELLAPLASEALEILPLYGELPVEAQDRAVDRGARRKIILSTNIAESSLTIDGVTCVVDCGFAKVLRHDPGSGIDRLELARISKKSAVQRAGRAGRTAPGRALRLWTEKEDRLFAESEQPEIMRVDLAPVLLEVLRWSPSDPRSFGWFERPPAASIERALRLLELLGATKKFALTPLGELLASFPLHPRLAKLLVSSHERGALEDGALIAALLSERDIVRRSSFGPRGARVSGSSDVLHRVDLFHARDGVDGNAARAVASVRDRLLEQARRLLPRASRRSGGSEDATLRALLAAFPDRVAKKKNERVQLSGGGAATMSEDSVVRDAELIVAVEIEGTPKGAVVRQASAIDKAWLAEETAGVVRARVARFNHERFAVECVQETRYGELVVESRPERCEDEEEVARVLAEAASGDLDRAVPIDDDASKLLARLSFLKRTSADLDLSLLDGDVRRAVLPSLCRGARSFAELRGRSLSAAIMETLPRELARTLDVLAPERIEIPSGRKAELRYDPDSPPVVSARLQEVFGMMKTPRVAGGRVPVKMELLAPNMRPVQVTQDLESFWSNTYAEVRNELRRRYPKHQWPEDPRDGDPRKKPGRR